VFAAMQLGIARFDACTAGIGGCPHAPGASGNVATEDLAYMLHSMGIATGLDYEQLLALRARVAQRLQGEPTHGTIWRAGLPKTIKPEAIHA
jgi:hydroxymethylglutaryl-CoA lyase